MRLTIGPARAKVVSFNNNQTRGSWVMKRVGILVGREKTFPDELIKRVNERGGGEVIAEFIKLGGVRHDAPPRYDVVVDRISHEVPFYRATLKRMALEGATIITIHSGGPRTTSSLTIRWRRNWELPCRKRFCCPRRTT